MVKKACKKIITIKMGKDTTTTTLRKANPQPTATQTTNSSPE